MKKSLSVVAFAALTIAAFAADPKVLVNARLRANLVTADLDDDSKNAGVTFGGFDFFGVEVRDERAGAKISLKGSLSGLTSAVTDVTTTTTSDTAGDVTSVKTTTKKTNANGVVIDDYWGWPVFGPFKVSAGEWEHRYADRLNQDGNQFGGYWDLKYGPLAYAAANEGYVVAFSESDNITPWTTGEAAGDYSANGLTLSASTGTSNGGPFSVAEFFGARVGYAIADKAVVTAAVIRNGENALTLGAYGKMLAVKNLAAVIGVSTYRDSDVDANSLTAVELRARYAIGAAFVTTHNNLTFGEDKTIVYDLVNFSYRVSASVVPAILVSRTQFDGDASVWEGSAITVRPGVSLFAQKNASIDAGLALTFNEPKSGDSSKVVTFPVVLRVIY